MPDDTTVFHKICQVGDYLWAVDYGNGRIHQSKNQGKDWQLQYETGGEFLEAIQFLDDKTGYVCGDYGIILKTEDGGNTWTSVAPVYEPNITKDNPQEGDSTAFKVNYYQMFFKDKDHGLVWGFERKPHLKSSRYFKFFFYETENGGDSWRRIDYNRRERGAMGKIVNTFLGEASLQGKRALETYYLGNKAFKAGRNGFEISEGSREQWTTYPFPQLPDERIMFRTIEFINDHQAYVFGGNLRDISSAYILETLDGGQSWNSLQPDLPHIHYTLRNGQEILLAGKDGLLKKWIPKAKKRKSIIHKGVTSSILIDGIMKKDEWAGANRTTIQTGVDMYTLQDEHFLYLSIRYDTALFANYYTDLYFETGKDTLLNLHASQQLGERILIGSAWTDSEPAIAWGYLSDWTANTIKFDRLKKTYIHYNTLEFQIAKSKIPSGPLRIALQTRDINWEKKIINLPEGGNFRDTTDWLLFHWE